jgi:Gpi18-like mannosyltransferase
MKSFFETVGLLVVLFFALYFFNQYSATTAKPSVSLANFYCVPQFVNSRIVFDLQNTGALPLNLWAHVKVYDILGNLVKDEELTILTEPLTVNSWKHFDFSLSGLIVQGKCEIYFKNEFGYIQVNRV